MSSYVAYARTAQGQLEPFAFVSADGPTEAARASGLPSDCVLRDCHEVPSGDVFRAQYRMQVRAAQALPARPRRTPAAGRRA